MHRLLWHTLLTSPVKFFTLHEQNVIYIAWTPCNRVLP